MNRKRSAGLEAGGRGTRNREVKVARLKAEEDEISDQVVGKFAVREPKVGNCAISE
jgi:hypothetical protein